MDLILVFSHFCRFRHMQWPLNDIMFLIESLKFPTDNFDIRDHVTFIRNSTRSGTHHKLAHPKVTSAIQSHFHFNRIVRLYNHLPVIDISLPINTIKRRLISYFWAYF